MRYGFKFESKKIAKPFVSASEPDRVSIIAVKFELPYLTGIDLILEFAFEDLGLHRVEAACLVHNEPSSKLLLKLGFSEEGLAREYLRIDGRWQDHRTFGILRSDRKVKS